MNQSITRFMAMLAVLILAFAGKGSAQTNCCNILTNGNFEQGNTGFTSGLPLNCACLANSYCVGPNFTTKCPGQWPSFTDHTTGSGNFLIIDGHPSAPVDVWRNTVNITTAGDYCFSFWAASVYNEPFDLGVTDNTTLVFVGLVAQAVPMWEQFTFTLNLTAGSHIIAIRQLTGGSKRDFGLDDIEFGQPLVANFVAVPDVNCGMNIQFFNQSTGPAPLTYFWNFNDPASGAANTSTQQNPTHNFTACKNYDVCLTVTRGNCSKNICISVASEDFDPPTAICLGLGVDLNANCMATITPGMINGGSFDNCGIASMSVSPSVLTGCGTFPVTLTVIDLCGNIGTCTVGVQTIEVVPPTLTCPPNITVQGTINAQGICKGMMPQLNVGATDNCPGNVLVTNNAPANGMLPSGPTVITYTATDACNNTATCTVTVTVACESGVCACPGGGQAGQNLIANGAFTFGNTGFGSGLPQGCGCLSNSYCVLPKFSDKCSGWLPGLGDHTYGIGNPLSQLLVIDGSTSGAADVWTQTIANVNMGTTYCFSFWAATVYPTPFGIEVTVGGSPIPGGAFTLNPPIGVWKQYTVTWLSNVNGPINLAIRQQTGGGERDFGLDDLCFRGDECKADFTFQPIGNCGNFQFTNTSMPATGLTYLWNFGDGQSPSNTSTLANPTHQFFPCSGTFTVCLTISGPTCPAMTVCKTVTVVAETTPPVITNCPQNQSVGTDLGKCYYTLPPLNLVVTDNCDPNPTLNCSVEDPFGTQNVYVVGAQLPKGVSKIRCWAIDKCGNQSAFCNYTITVSDKELPLIACPPNQTIFGIIDTMGNCKAVVNGLAPTVTDNCPMWSVSHSINGGPLITGDASGTMFMNGVSTVVYTVTDMGGNMVSCSFTITVNCDCPCPNGAFTGPNLVQNPNFSLGNQDFTSNYGYSASLFTEGLYFVGPNPMATHPNFQPCGDHTTGTGNMMIVNGATTAGQNVWCQTVPVLPEMHYQFCTWVASTVAANPAYLQFSINNTNLGGGFLAPAATCNWQQFTQTWFSGLQTSANICIVNQNTIAGGNDFALDDISFRKCSGFQPSKCEGVSAELADVHIGPANNCCFQLRTWVTMPNCFTGVQLTLSSGTFAGSSAGSGWTMSGTGATTTLIPSGGFMAVGPDVPILICNVGGSNPHILSVKFLYGLPPSQQFCERTIQFNCITLPLPIECEKNIVLNSGFSIGAIPGNLCFGPGISANWACATGTPQVGTTDFCDDPVSIQMWGNRDVGESICQTISGFFQAGKSYNISFCGRFLAQPNLPTQFVRIGFAASNGCANTFNCAGNACIGDAQISSQLWGKYSLAKWTPTQNYTTLNIRAFNNTPDAGPTTVSWGRIDNICIEEMVMDSCTADFDFSLVGCRKFMFNGVGNGTPPYTFSWNFGDGSGTFTGQNPMHQYNASGPFTVTLTVTDAAGCTATYSATVNVPQLPTASISGNLTICSGQSTTLTASGGGTYLWSPGSATTAAITVSPTVNTTYSVVVTDANFCTATASKQVTVNPKPTVTISGPPAAICKYQFATLTATASSGVTFAWSAGGATTASVQVNPLISTSYSVVVTGTNGCTASASFTVNVVNCDCPNSTFAQNGDFSSGTPNGNDESIQLATNWSGIWPPGANPNSNGDFWSTTPVNQTPTNFAAGLTTPTPVGAGQFAGMWCRWLPSDQRYREGIMNQLLNSIPKNSGCYRLKLNVACLTAVSGTPRLSIYGTSGATTQTATGPGPVNPSNFGLFPPGNTVLLGTYLVPGGPNGCTNNFMTISLPFNTTGWTCPPIDKIFLTRDDAAGGGVYLAIDEVCIEPVPCGSSPVCECGKLKWADFYQFGGGFIKPIACGAAPIKVPCAKQGQNYFIHGDFTCIPDACGVDEVTWVLDRPTLPDVTGSTLGAPYPHFDITLLWSHFTQPGVYSLKISRTCGTLNCPCEFKFEVLPCDCPCDKLQADVKKGFKVTGNKLFCKRTFMPIALCPNDAVTWTVTGPGMNATYNSTGNAMQMVTFPSTGGIYTVCMSVTRTVNGVPCTKFERCQKVFVKCAIDPNPTFCKKNAVLNGDFTEGIVAGDFANGASISNWDIFPNPGTGAVFVDSSGASDDGHVILEGGKDNFAGIFQKLDIPAMNPDSFSTVEFQFRNYLGDSTPVGTRLEFRLHSDSYAGTASKVLFTHPISGANAHWDSADFSLKILPDADMPYLVICVQNDDGSKKSVLGIDNLQICTSPIVSTEQPTEWQRYRLFPNPTTGELTIEWPGLHLQNGSVEFISSLGQTIRTLPVADGETRLNATVADLPQGIYFLKIRSAGRQLKALKFVKQ